jgi:hypothetical protein
VRYCYTLITVIFIVWVWTTIKHIKGSNRTFINDEPLGPERLESEPYELKLDNVIVCFHSLLTLIKPISHPNWLRIQNRHRRLRQQDYHLP